MVASYFQNAGDNVGRLEGCSYRGRLGRLWGARVRLIGNVKIGKVKIGGGAGRVQA